MGNTRLDTALDKVISDTGLPDDEYENHRFMVNLKVPDKLNTSASSDFNLLLNDLYESTVGGRNNTAAAELKRHCSLLLLNLADCALYHKWLVVHLSQKTIHGTAEDKDDSPVTFFYKRSNIKYRPLKHIIDYLVEEELVIKLQGMSFENKPMATRLFPKPVLRKQLIKIALEAEEAFEEPYLRFNEPDSDRFSDFKPADDHHEVQQMKEINDFLEEHTWACKSPVVQIYKGDFMKSGRLYTRFQNLPANRIPLRINTLIDNKPIAEVDFSANHLRINLALFAQEDAGDTPYEDIADIAGVNRAVTKSFVNRAIACSKRDECFNSLKRDRFNQALFDRVEAATYERFPEIILYKGFGINAQTMEGSVLRQALHIGVKAGIVMLPIHDAVAVQQEHADWAAQVLEECWVNDMCVASDGIRHENIKPRLKVNMP
jgi:hypothetical protein